MHPCAVAPWVVVSGDAASGSTLWVPTVFPGVYVREGLEKPPCAVWIGLASDPTSSVPETERAPMSWRSQVPQWEGSWEPPSCAASPGP